MWHVNHDWYIWNDRNTVVKGPGTVAQESAGFNAYHYYIS